MRKCYLLPLLSFPLLTIACGSAPPAAENPAQSSSSALSGSGSETLLGRYHWLPVQGVVPKQAYVAGMLDASWSTPPAHYPSFICRAKNALGSATSDYCAPLDPQAGTDMIQRFYDVLVIDDPDAFEWVPGSSGSPVPAGAISATPGQGPYVCRVWTDGDDNQKTRGVVLGVLNNGCKTPSAGTQTSSYQILVQRSPRSQCTDTIDTWPSSATDEQKSCDSGYSYSPACFKSTSTDPNCGVDHFDQVPVFKTCSDTARPPASWTPSSGTTWIHDPDSFDRSASLEAHCQDLANKDQQNAIAIPTFSGAPPTPPIGYFLRKDAASWQILCSVSYSLPNWAVKQDASCGIDHYVNGTPHYKACRLAAHGLDTAANCGSAPSQTPRGLSAAMAAKLAVPADDVQPVCLSAEEDGVDTPQQISAKFADLYANYQSLSVRKDKLAAEPFESAGAAAHIARELKTLFELHGEALSDATMRAFVLSLYAPPVASPSASLSKCSVESAVTAPAAASSLSLVARRAGVLDLLYTAPDASVRLETLSANQTDFSPQQNLKLALFDKPAAVAWGFQTNEDRLDIFGPAFDRTLHHTWWTPTAQGDDPLGGFMAEGAAVSSWASGRLDIVYVGADHGLRHRFWETGWHPYFSDEEPWGGNLVGTPAAVSWGSNRIDVFARNFDNTLWHYAWDNGSTVTETRGGQLASNPTVASWGPGRLDVLWRAPDNSLHHLGYDQGAQGWQNEENLGVALTGDPAAASWEPNRLDVVTTEPGTGQVVRRAFMNGANGSLNPSDCAWLDGGDNQLCGSGTPAVIVAPSCRTSNASGLRYEQDLTELSACRALSLPQVPATVVASEVDNCETSIGRLLAQKGDCSGGVDAAFSLALVNTALSIPLGTFSDPNDLRAELQKRLGHIQAWWAAQPLATRNAADADEVVGLLWKAVYGDMPASSSATLDETFNRRHIAAAALLEAAFTPGANGTAPLSSAPLGYVVSDALDPLVERLQTLGVFQDLACRYAANGCANVQTQLTQLWTAIGAIGTPQLSTAVSNATLLTGRWKDAFTALGSAPSVLAAAFLDATGSAAWNASSTAQAAPLEQLAKTVRTAQQRMGTFNSIEQLELGASNTIYTGMQDSKQADLLAQTETANAQLGSAVAGFTEARKNLLGDILTELSQQQQQTSLTDRMNSLLQQYDDETKSLQALRASDTADELRFASFMSSFQKMLDSHTFDPNMKIQVDAPQIITVSAADAHWQPGVLYPAVSNVAVTNGGVPWKVSGNPGDLLNIQATGLWAPTCSLSSATLPDGTVESAAGVAGVYTGPEGFTLTQNHGDYSVTSQQTSDSNFTQNTTVASDCYAAEGHLGVGWDFILKEGATLSHTTSTCDTDTSGTGHSETLTSGKNQEDRTTASFAAGLRLANTPFPNEPAGSLLLVQLKPGSPGRPDEVLDVRVVTQPMTVLVDQASDYILVVNDNAACSDDPKPLTITTTHLETIGGKVQSLGVAMATSYGRIRGQVDDLAKQGVVQPDLGALLRSEAYTDLRTDCQCDPTLYPQSLLSLFDTWLDKEVVRLERQVDIANTERLRRLTSLDINGVMDGLIGNGAVGRVAAQLPNWSMMSLDSALLGQRSKDLAEFAALKLYPIARLRYPLTFTTLANDGTAQAALTALLAVGWDTQVDLIAAAERNFVTELVQAYRNAVTDGQDRDQRIYYVALSIPNPDASVLIGAAPSPWKTIDEARSRQVWQGLQAGLPFTLALTPDDFYDAQDGNSVLSCEQSVPVVTAMSLYLAVSDNSYDDLNLLQAHTPAQVDSLLRFPTATGTQSYRFNNANWLSAPTPIFFGMNQVAVETLKQNLGTATAQAGLSPFTRFRFEGAPFKNQPGNPVASATELDVVFQVDSPPIAYPGLTYLPACH